MDEEWQIDPEGCRGILEDLAEEAEKFGDWGEGYAEHMESAATSSGTLFMGGGDPPQGGLVASALGEFAQERQPDLMAVIARTGNAMGGASSAVLAYMSGDLTMVRDAERDAFDAAEAIDRGEIPGLEPDLPEPDEYGYGPR